MNMPLGQRMTYANNITNVMIVAMYVPNNLASKYIKQVTMDRLEVDQ